MSGPTLGQVIKGARLGYGSLGWAFVRITDVPGGFEIDVRPGELLPATVSDQEHRIWWKGTDDVESARGQQLVSWTVRQAIAGGMWPTAVRRVLRFVVDEAGRPVASLQR